MKQLLISFGFILFSCAASAQDSTFWEHGWDNEPGEKEIVERDWGREVVTYLGTVTWKSPSGKELKIRIVTAYQQITKANGFEDRSVLALVKTDHTLIKSYDMVKRKNLPIDIKDNKLLYKPASGEEILSALPAKIGARLCVTGLTCFSQIIL
jgi:hypothetical protein